MRGDGNEAPKAYALRRMSEGGRAEAVKDVSGCVDKIKVHEKYEFEKLIQICGSKETRESYSLASWTRE